MHKTWFIRSFAFSFIHSFIPVFNQNTYCILGTANKMAPMIQKLNP